jgi:hypothetical protein
MDPGKDASKLGTAFLHSAAICMHYRQIGCAKSVVDYRMSKLLKPAFAVLKGASCAFKATCLGYSTQLD